MNILLQLLAILRALEWSHQTAHWKVRGEPFYGDHLLFQKLYEAVGEEIDTLAEKIVGIYGPDAIHNLSVLSDTHKFVANHAASGVGGDIYQCALLMEEHLQRALKTAYDELKASGEMSLGMDDFLMATANAHETALYLLRQRNRPKAASAKTAAYGDPYWMTAKYPGRDNKGNPFKKGERVFYYPRTKTILTGPEAEKASLEFAAAKFDEDGY
jgi:DNA-binding ferritin-like protein